MVQKRKLYPGGIKPPPVKKPNTRKPSLDHLPVAEQERIIKERLLAEQKLPGGTTFEALGQRYGLTMRTVRRWYINQPEARRQAVLAKYMQQKAKQEAQESNSLAVVLGDDIEADFRWVLRELRRLIEEGQNDDDRILQLASLRETSKVLEKLANLLGLMSKKVDVSVNLNQSPQWLEMRDVLMRVLRDHPEALASFQHELAQMRGGPVLEHQP